MTSVSCSAPGKAGEAAGARLRALASRREPSARSFRAQGREPLHIAAYKCSEDMIDYLVKLGAKNTVKDAGGNTPSALAGRTPGRDKVKALIEELVATAGAAA